MKNARRMSRSSSAARLNAPSFFASSTFGVCSRDTPVSPRETHRLGQLGLAHFELFHRNNDVGLGSLVVLELLDQQRLLVDSFLQRGQLELEFSLQIYTEESE